MRKRDGLLASALTRLSVSPSLIRSCAAIAAEVCERQYRDRGLLGQRERPFSPAQAVSVRIARS